TRGIALLQQSLALFQEIGDQRSAGQCLLSLGFATLQLGDLESARAHWDASLAIYRALEDRWGIAVCLVNLAAVSCFLEEDYGSARALLEESRALFRELGPGSPACLNLTVLARLARFEGDYARARAHATEALALAQKVGFRRGVAICLDLFGALAAAQEQ